MSGVEPTMNIVNQINAALQDVRGTLVELATWGMTPDVSDQMRAENKAGYQLSLAIQMINDHRLGINHPWSTLKYQVDEEFS